MNPPVRCPNCTEELFRNPKRGEHTWECAACEGVWFIILTVVPRLPEFNEQPAALRPSANPKLTTLESGSENE